MVDRSKLRRERQKYREEIRNTDQFELVDSVFVHGKNDATVTMVEVQGGPIKYYHFSIIPKLSNVNLFKIFIQRFVIRNIKPTFNINEFVKSELCR